MACLRCVEDDCSVRRAARSLLGAWVRERKRQLGSRAADLTQDIPDRESMERAVPSFEADCLCKCHS